MSAPRRVVPGTTYLVTRRCYQRTFRLRPSDETTEILAYCLGLATEKTGILLHAVCFMSNHHHMVVTDPLGQLPDFLRELHRLTAKAMNAAQGQWENLWSAEPCSAVLLADDEDIIDKIAYVAVNPVAAGLVSRPEEWPGLSLWTEGTMTVAKPWRTSASVGNVPTRFRCALCRRIGRMHEPPSLVSRRPSHTRLRKLTARSACWDADSLDAPPS